MVRGNHEHRLLRRLCRQARDVHDGHRLAKQLAETLGADRTSRLRQWIERSPYAWTGGAKSWMKNKERWLAVHAGPDMQSHGIPDILNDASLRDIDLAFDSEWCGNLMDSRQVQLVNAATTLTEIRYLDPHDQKHWSRFHKSSTLVIYGHNPCQDPRFAELKFTKRGAIHSIGLDTGCVYGGRLSGFWIEEGPAGLVSTPACERYCEIPQRSKMRRR